MSEVRIGQKSNHPYKVVDNGGFPVLGNTEWSARECLHLLDSAEQYGYGNWEDVSQKIAKLDGRSSSRSSDEVKGEFCQRFIEGTLGLKTWNEDDRGRARDHTQGNILLPPSQNPETPPNISIHECIMLGYMPKRDDFEAEFDNHAESLVSQLQDGIDPNPEEDDMDLALKVAHIDMYKSKLRERERRKRVSREHQLISQFFKENPLINERKVSFSKKRKDRNDPTERLKVMAEFQGVDEHRAFIGSVTKERELKQRIKELQRYRKNGVLKLKDSHEYESQRLRRIRRRKELGKRSEICDSPLSIKSEDWNTSGSPMMSNISALSPKPEEKPLAIIGMPGYELLSSNERKLCANLKLTPAHYISYKTCLLTHHLQKKKGQTPKPLNPVGLDKNNRKIIFQFLMRAGWITAY
eukprot:maker-scaffold64_size435223-snap-gene-2.30 protein:Tk02498 transcript:maker-scaffold64_size435223-snap-gene-2.30-mRNA-1 annotation:"low quality protein: transcriptional adapter 2-beta"